MKRLYLALSVLLLATFLNPQAGLAVERYDFKQIAKGTMSKILTKRLLAKGLAVVKRIAKNPDHVAVVDKKILGQIPPILRVQLLSELNGFSVKNNLPSKSGLYEVKVKFNTYQEKVVNAIFNPNIIRHSEQLIWLSPNKMVAILADRCPPVWKTETAKKHTHLINPAWQQFNNKLISKSVKRDPASSLGPIESINSKILRNEPGRLGVKIVTVS